VPSSAGDCTNWYALVSETNHVLLVFENMVYPSTPRPRAFVQAMRGHGERVTVAGPTGYGLERLEERADGVRILRYAAPPPGTGIAGYVREFGVSFLRLRRLVRRVAREDRPDVVVVHNPPDFLMLLARPLARRGTAVVFDDRELSPELYEAKFGRRGPVVAALVAIERFAFRRADAILVTNPSYVANVCDRAGVPAERVFVVGNGPDPSRIYEVDARPELRRGRQHLVLWLGVMSRQDGLDHLVEAADELVNRRGRKDVTFAIVGPGEVVDELRAEVARRGLDGVVDVPGRVDDDAVRAYLSTADVCVGVDPRNDMNDRAAMRKVLEYMAMGRAVVQYPLTEMQRICGDATKYARDADPRDLAAKIEDLLDDPDERRRLGEAARTRIRDERLLWPDQAKSFLRAVEAARARRSAGRRK